MKRILLASALVVTAASALTVAQTKAPAENKNITIIRGESTADGKSEVSERILEECIVALPGTADLQADVAAQSQFLKEINGDPGRNDFAKTYTAAIDINYMLYQKVLIVVTTNAISGQEPVMKVMEKNIRQTKRFESNSANGDIYAGRSRRQYYFSTEEAAVKDAQERAMVWLRQQAAVVCKAK